jgi:hypothetical protein
VSKVANMPKNARSQRSAVIILITLIGSSSNSGSIATASAGPSMAELAPTMLAELATPVVAK